MTSSFAFRPCEERVILSGDHERVASSANQTSGNAELAAQTVIDSRRLCFKPHLRRALLVAGRVSCYLRCGFPNSTTICLKN
jgi:hypothetical protein